MRGRRPGPPEGGRGRQVPRREALIRLLALCGVPVAAGRSARASLTHQTACPDLEGRRIRWLVGYSPGGGYDVYSRLIEPYLGRALGAEIFVDNVPGASGIVAARLLAAARPDGRTLGLIDGPGLLMANRRGLAQAPGLGEDLVPLVRVSRLHPVLVAAEGRGLRTIDDVLAMARRRAIVFGITGPLSQNFVNCSVTASLFGFDAEFVAGYPGSRDITLAIQRGDLDMAAFDTSSALTSLRAGRLVPLLRIAPGHAVDAGALEGVPHLGGAGGLVVRRPELFASSDAGGAASTRARAERLVTFTSLGRLVVAPAGLSAGLERCLEAALGSTLADPDFRASAGRSDRPLDVIPAARLGRALEAASTALDDLLPVIERAAGRVR